MPPRHERSQHFLPWKGRSASGSSSRPLAGSPRGNCTCQRGTIRVRAGPCRGQISDSAPPWWRVRPAPAVPTPMQRSSTRKVGWWMSGQVSPGVRTPNRASAPGTCCNIQEKSSPPSDCSVVAMPSGPRIRSMAPGQPADPGGMVDRRRYSIGHRDIDLDPEWPRRCPRSAGGGDSWPAASRPRRARAGCRRWCRCPGSRWPPTRRGSSPTSTRPRCAGRPGGTAPAEWWSPARRAHRRCPGSGAAARCGRRSASA